MAEEQPQVELFVKVSLPRPLPSGRPDPGPLRRPATCSLRDGREGRSAGEGD